MKQKIRIRWDSVITTASTFLLGVAVGGTLTTAAILN